MAHRITYKPQGIILSSAIGELSVAVDGTFVDVTLTGPGGHTILSERYYAYSGNVTLYNLGSLIEAEMRLQDIRPLIIRCACSPILSTTRLTPAHYKFSTATATLSATTCRFFSKKIS